MKPARVPIAEIPAALLDGPQIVTCHPCGAKIVWAVRDDRNELGTPLYPEPKPGGNMVILGFTRDSFGNVLPLVADVHHTHELPDWENMPGWTRRKRWLHHAPECRSQRTGRRPGLSRI